MTNIGKYVIDKRADNDNNRNNVKKITIPSRWDELIDFEFTRYGRNRDSMKYVLRSYSTSRIGEG